MIDDLLRDLKSLQRLVSKNKAVNVNVTGTKQLAISLGSDYFAIHRAELLSAITEDSELSEYDEDWQRLVRLGHRNNAKPSYASLLKRLLTKTTDLAIRSHSATPSATSGSTSARANEVNELLVRTLEELVPSAALSYRQAVQDLMERDLRLSYRGTACEFREALRETLDLLAPDNEVTAQSGFKLQPNTTGPTMKQKVRFILSSRGRSKSNRGLSEKSVDLIEGLCGDVARAVYNRASLSTHAQSTKADVSQIKRYLDAVFFDILEIGGCGTT